MRVEMGEVQVLLQPLERPLLQNQESTNFCRQQTLEVVEQAVLKPGNEPSVPPVTTTPELSAAMPAMAASDGKNAKA